MNVRSRAMLLYIGKIERSIPGYERAVDGRRFGYSHGARMRWRTVTASPCTMTCICRWNERQGRSPPGEVGSCLPVREKLARKGPGEASRRQQRNLLELK